MESIFNKETYINLAATVVLFLAWIFMTTGNFNDFDGGAVQGLLYGGLILSLTSIIFGCSVIKMSWKYRKNSSIINKIFLVLMLLISSCLILTPAYTIFSLIK